MSQPNEIPRFTGEENPEEAEKWLSILISSTGSFTESGIFRLMQSKFPVGSIAQAWFDGLEDTATTSWKVFRPKFYDRWIATSQQQEWEAFRHHVLSEETIFEKNIAVQLAHERIGSWVDDHLQLGIATGHGDSVLIDATKQLLPPSIRAYLQAFVKPEPKRFEALCNEIKGVTEQILEYELTRRSLSATEWSCVIETLVLGISEKVDRLIKTNGDGATMTVAAPSWSSSTKPVVSQTSWTDNDNTSCTESVNWEPSSPLTSVLSDMVPPTVSGLCTPTAQPVEPSCIPKRQHVSESTLEGASDPQAATATLITSNINAFSHLYRIPREWRKPICLKTRDELIVIAQRAIDFVENYGEKINVKVCQRRSFRGAVAIRDQYIDSCRYAAGVPFNETGQDSVYDDLLLAISRIYSYHAYQKQWFRVQPPLFWAENVESKDATKNIIKADTHKIRVSDHDHYLHLSPYGGPSLVGGLFAPNLEKGSMLVSSAKTVMFMTLSAHLVEITGEKKYGNIGILAANCIKLWMLDPMTRLVKDCLIDAQNAQERGGSEISCHLTGIAIEGFTMLATVTGEESWRTLAIEIARSAMCYQPWHSPDGILTVYTDKAASENTISKTFKGVLNRGLLAAYERNRSNEPFCNMVRCYINVQFNALYELSRLRDAYGMDWRGPYAGPYGHAQIAAFDTIVAALGVNGG
ncbi:hypothetical protein FRC03_002792 [Tulasnella sp. 419]|nr:hypothetical protein FRC03_002792 [Tulasnella sp. 419]